MLGPIELVGAAGPVGVGGPKERAVLAMLALDAGRTVSVASLIEGLWGEDLPLTASKIIQNYVLRLRKVLAATPDTGLSIETHPGGYALKATSDALDTWILEQLLAQARQADMEQDQERRAALLGRALELWRGDALAEFADYCFARPAAVRFAELRKGIVEDLIGAELDLGRHERWVSELEALTAADPLRERLWALRMLALYRCGRQADALGAYKDLRRHLAEQLGLDPGSELAELERRILMQDPKLEWIDRPLPSGMVTFLFADIEGSTRLFHRLGDDYETLLNDSRRLLRKAIQTCGGVEVKIEGDSAFLAAFASPVDALHAAGAAQQTNSRHQFPADTEVQLRVGLHTGPATAVGGDYIALAVHQVARMAAAAHGGQVLVSEATAGSVADLMPKEMTLTDIGVYQLREFPAPEHLFQLCQPDLHLMFPPVRALSVLAHNLPRARTSFIGRTAERTELLGLLRESGLVTLVGPGGVGKTRLAIEVAFDAVDSYPDGAWLVELAALSDPELVPQALARILGLREDPTRSLTDILTTELRNKAALIVIDNCEHLVDASALLVEALVQSCPELGILATSREALRVDGEIVWRLAPLATPDLDGPVSFEALPGYDAVRLFVERARLKAPHFELSPGTANAVISITSRLDGIPLALELAAAKVAQLNVAEIAGRLDDRFELLTGGRRSALPRQQTLEATIAWSFELLAESERLFLCRLAVFAGGFTIQAAGAVCTPELGDRDVRDLIARMVERSLVLADPTENGCRYRLLETVREYAWLQLSDGDRSALRSRHLAWFQPLVEQAGTQIGSPNEGTWLDEVDLDHSNLREAMAWCLAEEPPDVGLKLSVGLAKFCWIRGYPAEGLACLDEALKKAPDAPPTLRARTLLEMATLLYNLDGPTSWAHSWEAFALFRSVNDRQGTADALCAIGFRASLKKDYRQARTHLEEALGLYRELGDQRGTALALGHLGDALYALGHAELARAHFSESHELLRLVGDRRELAWSLGSLSLLAEGQDEDHPTAAAGFDEALAIFRELGYPEGEAWALCGLGQVALDTGDLADADARFTEAEALQRRFGLMISLQWALSGLGHVALAKGDLACARARFLELFALAATLIGTVRPDLSVPLHHLAILAVAEGRPASAVSLFAASSAQSDSLPLRLSLKDRRDSEQALSTIRDGLDEDVFEAAWAAGSSLTPEAAMAHVFRSKPASGRAWNSKDQDLSGTAG